MDGMNKEKWKAFSSREKWEHIWYYYNKVIIAAVIIALSVTWFVYEGVTKRDPLMSVIMLNMPDNTKDQTGFQGFLEEYGYEVYPGAVGMTTHLYIQLDSGDPQTIQRNYEMVQILHAMLSVGDQELIFGTGKWYEETLIHSGALMDLSKVLPESLLEACGDALVYSKATETEPSYPCAIKLDDSAWLKQSGYYKTCYVGVFTNTDNLKMATECLTYILEQ